MEHTNCMSKYPEVGDYILEKTFGVGLNSKVKLGLKTSNGQYYALKILRQVGNIEKNKKALINEAKIRLGLSHLHIINQYEFLENATYKKRNGTTYPVIVVVLELAKGGELFDFISESGRFNEMVARTYFHQMITGLEYLHKLKIAHRDMKPENLLFDLDFNLKIADFGFSTHMDRQLKTYNGTVPYMAPEIHAKQPYSGSSVDLFASGIILFIMLAGTPPFLKADSKDPTYNLIFLGRFETFWGVHQRFKPKDFFSKDFKDLLIRMLAYDPALRLTIDEIKEHPWCQGPCATMENIRNEFLQRKQQIDHSLEIERNKKQIEKEKRKQLELQRIKAAERIKELQKEKEKVADKMSLENVMTIESEMTSEGISKKKCTDTDESENNSSAQKNKKKTDEEEKKNSSENGTKQRNIAYTGTKGFRSIGNDSEFAAVDEMFKDDLAVQKLVKIDRNPQPQDYMSVCDIDYLFKAILLQLLELKVKNQVLDISINKHSYKIDVRFRNDEEPIEIVITFGSFDEECNVVGFLKKNGNLFIFYEIINNLKEGLGWIKRVGKENKSEN